jgi:acyl-CoA hydrolase
MTEYVLPQHANPFGTVFGGQIMAWVDLCAAICAQRHSGRLCVTAFVDDLHFRQPVRVGEVVRLRAHIAATFRTSMEIAVSVTGENTLTGASWPTVDCRMTFVAMGEGFHPTPVPPLLLHTPAERADQTAAEERRQLRLAKR